MKNFPPEFPTKFNEIIDRHQFTFRQGGRLHQTIAAIKHEIHLSETRAFHDPPKRYSDEKRAWIDAQVREMLADGIIEASTAP